MIKFNVCYNIFYIIVGVGMDNNIFKQKSYEELNYEIQKQLKVYFVILIMIML